MRKLIVTRAENATAHLVKKPYITNLTAQKWIIEEMVVQKGSHFIG